jgi:hypothetical protein
MQSVPRKLTLGLILAMGVAACGDDVTVDQVDPPAPVVRSVLVTPSSATIAQGGTFQFGASVDADAGVSTAVTWSASGGTGITVDQNGLAAASASATGTGSICATSTVNTNAKSCAQLAVTPASPPATVQIDAITIGCTQINLANPAMAGIPCGFNTPVSINNVFGQIDVRGTVDRKGSSDVKAVRIEVFAADASGNPVGAAEYTNKETLLTDEADPSLALQSNITGSINHSIQTADYTLSPSTTAPTSAKAVHANGQKVIRLTLLGVNDVPLSTSSTSQRTLTFRNANGFHVIVGTNLNTGNNANSTCGASGTAACPIRVNALAGPTAGLAYNGGTPLNITALPVIYATGALHPNGFNGTIVQSPGTGVGFGSAACDLLGAGSGGGARFLGNATVTIPAGTTGNTSGTLAYTNVTPTPAAPAPAGSVTGYQMAPVCANGAAGGSLIGEVPFGGGVDANGNPVINIPLAGVYGAANTLNNPFGPVSGTHPTAPAIRLDNGGPAPIFGYATGRNDIGVGGFGGPDACFGLWLNTVATTHVGIGCGAPPTTLLVGGVVGGASINLNPATAFVGSPAAPGGRTARMNGWINSVVAFNALSQTAVVASGLVGVSAGIQSTEGLVAPSANATGLPLDAGIGAGVVGGNPVTFIGRVGACTTVATCATAAIRTTGAGLAETSTGNTLGAIVQSVDAFGNLTNPPAPGSVGGPGATFNFGTVACPGTFPNALCLNNPLDPARPYVAGGVLFVGFDNTNPTVLARGAGGIQTVGTTFTDNTIQGSAAANFDYQADDAIPTGLTGTSGILTVGGNDLYVSLSRRDGATTQFFCTPAGNYQPANSVCPSTIGTGNGWVSGGTTYNRGAGVIPSDPGNNSVRAYYQSVVKTRDQAGNETTAAVITAQTRDFIYDNTPPASFGAVLGNGIIPAGGSLTFTGTASEDLDIGRGAFSIRYPSLTNNGVGADFIRMPWSNKAAGTGILANPIGYTDPGPSQVALGLALQLSSTWNSPIRSLEVVGLGDNTVAPFFCDPDGAGPLTGAGPTISCPGAGAAATNPAASVAPILNFIAPGGLNGGGVAITYIQDPGAAAGPVTGGAGPSAFNWFAQSVSRVGLIANAAGPQGTIPPAMSNALNYGQSGQSGQTHPCGGPIGALGVAAYWSAVQGCGPAPGGVVNPFFNMMWSLANPTGGAGVEIDLSGNAGGTDVNSKVLTAVAFGANGPMPTSPFLGGVRFYVVDVRQPININDLNGAPAGTGAALVEVCGPNTGNAVSGFQDQATNTWQFTCTYNPSTGAAASVLQTNDLAGFNFANSVSLMVNYAGGQPVPGVSNAGFWGLANLSGLVDPDGAGPFPAQTTGFNQGWQGGAAIAGLVAATNMPAIAVGCNQTGNCLATRLNTSVSFNVQP